LLILPASKRVLLIWVNLGSQMSMYSGYVTWLEFTLGASSKLARGASSRRKSCKSLRNCSWRVALLSPSCSDS
jgi:hypothetical protein